MKPNLGSFVLALFLVGCTTETEHLLIAMPDGGGRNNEANQPVQVDSGIDSGTPIDTAVTEAALPEPAIDSGVATEAAQSSCVQQAIDNGYASCLPNDPYHASCDLCAGGGDPRVVSCCKSTIDCLAKHPNCDSACLDKCLRANPNPGFCDVALMCIYKVVTPFCGPQPWHPDVAWGCKKAL